MKFLVNYITENSNFRSVSEQKRSHDVFKMFIFDTKGGFKFVAFLDIFKIISTFISNLLKFFESFMASKTMVISEVTRYSVRFADLVFSSQYIGEIPIFLP